MWESCVCLLKPALLGGFLTIWHLHGFWGPVLCSPCFHGKCLATDLSTALEVLIFINKGSHIFFSHSVPTVMQAACRSLPTGLLSFWGPWHGIGLAGLANTSSQIINFHCISSFCLHAMVRSRVRISPLGCHDNLDPFWTVQNAACLLSCGPTKHLRQSTGPRVLCCLPWQGSSWTHEAQDLGSRRVSQSPPPAGELIPYWRTGTT